MIDLLMPTIAQGLLWAIMALGVYITYRVLDIADLTVEGSFPLGAAVAASLLAGGYSPWLAFGAAMLAGMLAGVATGLLHTQNTGSAGRHFDDDRFIFCQSACNG